MCTVLDFFSLLCIFEINLWNTLLVWTQDSVVMDIQTKPNDRVLHNTCFIRFRK